jgi:hypothetical protein
MRLPRDHYLRLDSNDYSVHPAVIGRMIQAGADLSRLQVWCEGRLVADHQRVWARHQTISDFDHLLAGRLLRRDRVEVLHPVQTEVEVRNLADYDSALGVLTGADDGAA